MKDYYKILGLSSSATLNDIRTNYKKLILELRSQSKNDKDVKSELANVLEAYEVLKNPLSKRKYDAVVNNKFSSSKGVNTNISSSKVEKYSRRISKVVNKSKGKSNRIISKTDKKLNSEFSVGDVLFNFGEILEFILSIVSVFLK